MFIDLSLPSMLSDAPAAAQSKCTALGHSTIVRDLPNDPLMESLGSTRPAMAQALFDSMRSLSCITGYLGQYLAANAAFTAALGWTEEELRGFAYYDLAPSAERQRMIKVGSDIIRNPADEPKIYKRPMRHKDGSYRLIEWTVWADPKNRLVYGIGHLLGRAEVE
jgi:PAS domain S-box-containing protein